MLKRLLRDTAWIITVHAPQFILQKLPKILPNRWGNSRETALISSNSHSGRNTPPGLSFPVFSLSSRVLKNSKIFRSRSFYMKNSKHQLQGRMFKKASHLTRLTPARQDTPFHGQGRRPFGARSIHGVREHNKGPTCLREAAPEEAGNAAGGPFGYAQGRLFQHPARNLSDPEAVYTEKLGET